MTGKCECASEGEGTGAAQWACENMGPAFRFLGIIRSQGCVSCIHVTLGRVSMGGKIIIIGILKTELSWNDDKLE